MLGSAKPSPSSVELVTDDIEVVVEDVIFVVEDIVSSVVVLELDVATLITTMTVSLPDSPSSSLNTMVKLKVPLLEVSTFQLIGFPSVQVRFAIPWMTPLR